MSHFLAHSDFVPRSSVLGTPPCAWGYVDTRPECRPLVIPSPALKRWGPSRRQGYVATRPTFLILSLALTWFGPPMW